jgi:hypothetical protein
MDRRTVRRWFGKRPWWVVFRVLITLEDGWDEWFGQLTLTGVDPRRWDLHQLLAAYEAALKQGAKDEAAWRRVHGQLYAEPKEVKQERVAAARTTRATTTEQPTAARGAMTLDSVEALLAGASARDAQYGAA